MKVKLHYKFDKEYYCLDMVSQPYYKTCEYCGGKGKVTSPVNKKELDCLNCKGKGEISKSGGLEEVVIPCYLHKVEMKSNKGGGYSAIYIFRDKDFNVLTNFGAAFKTKEEAEENKTRGIIGYTN